MCGQGMNRSMLIFNIRLVTCNPFMEYVSICFLRMTRLSNFIFIFFFPELLTAKSKTSTKDRQYKLLAGEQGVKSNILLLLQYQITAVLFSHNKSNVIGAPTFYRQALVPVNMPRSGNLNGDDPCTAPNFYLSGVFKACLQKAHFQ